MNLHTLTPVDGDTWDLQGHATMSPPTALLSYKSLPASFAINGIASGSTITLNDGANHHTVFRNVAALSLSNVTFTGGGWLAEGGVLYGGATMALTTSANVNFSNNNGAYGAAIYGADLNLSNSGDLNFSQNTGQISGAVHADHDVTLNNTGNVIFSGNRGNGNWGAGAIYAANNVTLNTNSAISFINNTTAGRGGAIYAGNHFSVSGGIIANNNTAASMGGAIAAIGDVLIDGRLTANDNQSTFQGGGIVAQTVTITGAVTMDGNVTTNSYGGAIYTSASGRTTVDVNLATLSGDVFLTNNKSRGDGGAIYGSAANIGNAGGTVTITGNSNTQGLGGAIVSMSAGLTTTLTGTRVTLSDNTSLSTTQGMGGGIYSVGHVQVNGDLVAERNSISFNDTNALGGGGAINAYRGLVNVTGSASFEGNKASQGGALMAATVNLASVAGDVALTSNMTSKGGGAVYATSAITIGSTSGDVSVRDNLSGMAGGALHMSGASGKIEVGNSGGTTVFSGNTAGYVDANGVASANPVNTTAHGGAIYSGGAVTLTGNVSFTNNAASGKGGAIWASGDVMLNATGGDITFSGNTHGDPVASAIYLNNTGSNKAAAFNADAAHTIAFYDPIENNSANGIVAVEKTGAGALSFDGSRVGTDAERWSKIFAATTVSAGIFEVANGAVYGALAAEAPGAMALTSFTSAAGSRVQGGAVGSIRADNVTLNGDVSIAGRQSAVRSVLNVASSNLTLGGGTVYFNTHLDDGTSGNTDLLVLDLNNSATSGQSFISVANIGGSGAITVGDGIKLVETNGSGTTDGAFMLGSRVSAGAYDYLLFQGGVGNNADDQNWYLRSTYNPEPTPPGCEFTDTCLSQQPVPIIRDEVAVSMAIPPLAIEYGYSMLGTLHERVGETYLTNAAPVSEERTVWCKDASQNFKCVVRVPVVAAKNEPRWASSGWARLMGDRGLNQPDNFAKRGPNYDYTFGGLQAGLDLFAREQADGTLDKAGIYVGYGQITSNVKGQFGAKAGTVDMDAYTVGGYWTHHGASGWYTDAVIQGTWYAADAKSVYGQRIKPDGFGILASLEAGYAFKLGNGFTVEPQAQIAYQNISFDNARDAYGFVRFDDGESVRGRFGVRVTKSWNMADSGQETRLVTAWLRANVWHEFMGKTTTSWGSLDGQNMTPFNSTLGGTWGELGAGVTAQVSDTVNLFATGAYNRSLDNKGREGWDGRLGMTVKW